MFLTAITVNAFSDGVEWPAGKIRGWTVKIWRRWSWNEAREPGKSSCARQNERRFERGSSWERSQ